MSQQEGLVEPQFLTVTKVASPRRPGSEFYHCSAMTCSLFVIRYLWIWRNIVCVALFIFYTTKSICSKLAIQAQVKPLEHHPQQNTLYDVCDALSVPLLFFSAFLKQFHLFINYIFGLSHPFISTLDKSRPQYSILFKSINNFSLPEITPVQKGKGLLNTIYYDNNK